MNKTLLTFILMMAAVPFAHAQKILTFDDTTDLTEKINTAAEAGGKRWVKFTDRAINGGIWNVLVLPFDIDIASLSDAFGYAAFDVMDEANASGNIHFKQTARDIKANTPFLFKPTTDPRTRKENFTEVRFKDVLLEQVTEQVEQTDAAGNKIVGIYAPTTFYGPKYWYLSKGVWYGSSLYTESAPVQLKALRAYIDFTGNTKKAAPLIIVDEPDGSTTAIDVATFNEGSFRSTSAGQDNAWYTLTGNRLTEAPATKGVYIHHGRKVVIR